MMQLPEKDWTYIKENFYIWLIGSKIYSDSTARRFIGTLNKICKDFFINDIKDPWIYLFNNMYTIFMYYYECSQIKNVFNYNEVSKEKGNYENILSDLTCNDKFKKSPFPQTKITFICGKREVPVNTVSLDLIPLYLDVLDFVGQQFALSPSKIKNIQALNGLYCLRRNPNVNTYHIVEQIATSIQKFSNTNLSSIYISLQYPKISTEQPMKALMLFREFYFGPF